LLRGRFAGELLVSLVHVVGHAPEHGTALDLGNVDDVSVDAAEDLAVKAVCVEEGAQERRRRREGGHVGDRGRRVGRKS
jgi:hypothetical protein